MNLDNRKLKISFVLPSSGKYPIGGFKIIYEYANRLSQRGHELQLIHAHKTLSTNNLLRKFYRFIEYNCTRISSSYKPNNWFGINNEVKYLWIRKICDKYIPNSDIIFATAWSTAEPVLKLKREKGQKFYFIQSLETWSGPDKLVLETWKYPMNKIVIARWLLEYAKSINEDAYFIPNGFNINQFGIDINPESRNSKNICLLIHNSEVKGSKYAISALKELKDEMNDINVFAFGTHIYKENLPGWIKFFKNPSQDKLRSIYNNSSIFISPSVMEGFPLPPGEAMMCGTAVIASDIEGHREYLVNEYNSLLFPTRDISSIIQCIKRLILDKELRCRIANQGLNDIRKFSWDNSIDNFEKYIITCLDKK